MYLSQNILLNHKFQKYLNEIYILYNRTQIIITECYQVDKR